MRISKQNKRFKEFYVEKSYISLKEEDKCNFIDKLENDFKNSEVNSIENLNKKIAFNIEKTLTKTYKKKTDQTNKKEKPWFNEDIRKLIKIRQLYNRKRRNISNQEEKKKFEDLYLQQKIRVKCVVRQEIDKHERKITN